MVLFVHGLHTVGTGSFGRTRLATVDGGQRIHVLFDEICPGTHDLHLFKIK
jgi:hypothetical protein